MSEPLAAAAARQYMIESGQPERDAEQAEKTWTTTELQADFEVLNFLAPFVEVRRKSDGALGTLEFRHSPRVYFDFRAHS